MAPLLHASWRRQARTSVDDKIATSAAGVTLAVDGSSDSEPSTSPPADKPLGEGSSTKIGAGPALTTSQSDEQPKLTPAEPTRTTSTPESHHSPEPSPATISQTSVNDVPDQTSSTSPDVVLPTTISRDSSPISSTIAPDPFTGTIPRVTATPITIHSTTALAPSPASSELTTPTPAVIQNPTTVPKPGPGPDNSPNNVEISDSDVPTIPPVPTETRTSEGPTMAATNTATTGVATSPSSIVTSTSAGTSSATTATTGGTTLSTSLSATTSTPSTLTTGNEQGELFTPTSSPSAPGTSSELGVSVPETGEVREPSEPPTTAVAQGSSGSLTSTTLPVAQAAQTPGSSTLTTITSVTTFTTTSGDSTFTTDVTITSTQIRTTMVPVPTSTTINSGTKQNTNAMIGGAVGASIVILATLLLAWFLICRRRHNEEIRTLLVASPDPFPHSARPSSQAMSPASPPGSGQMIIQTYPSIPMPRSTYSDPDSPNTIERLSDHSPSTNNVTRKKPIPFLNALDLGAGSRLSVRPASPFLMYRSPESPAAAENPFLDPARNPFEDPRPVIPTVVVHPATPEPRLSAMYARPDSRETILQYGVAM